LPVCLRPSTAQPLALTVIARRRCLLETGAVVSCSALARDRSAGTPPRISTANVMRSRPIDTYCRNGGSNNAGATTDEHADGATHGSARVFGQRSSHGGRCEAVCGACISREMQCSDLAVPGMEPLAPVQLLSRPALLNSPALCARRGRCAPRRSRAARQRFARLRWGGTPRPTTLFCSALRGRGQQHKS
jgi:hypothetical protein